MTWMEVDGEKLKEPEIDMKDFLKSLKVKFFFFKCF